MDFPEIRWCECEQDFTYGVDALGRPNVCPGCKEERLTFIQIVREMGLAAHLDSEGDGA